MWRWGRSARAAVILASILVIYLPALRGGYLWDDQRYVQDNFMRLAFVADHFQYLASIAFIALVIGAATTMFGTVGARVPAARPLGPAILSVVALALGATSWTRASVHRDEEALWRDTIARNPVSAVAHDCA